LVPGSGNTMKLYLRRTLEGLVIYWAKQPKLYVHLLLPEQLICYCTWL